MKLEDKILSKQTQLR